MDKCTGRRDITEITLKNAVKHRTINQSIIICLMSSLNRCQTIFKLGITLIILFVSVDGLDGWEVTASGGNGFLVEEQAGSCKPIQEVNVDAKGKNQFFVRYIVK